MNNCTFVFETFEECTDFLFYNINSLFDKIINEKYKNKNKTTTRNNNYKRTQNINRSSSDSNIEYSITNPNNPDSWEMLQIRLV